MSWSSASHASPFRQNISSMLNESERWRVTELLGTRIEVICSGMAQLLCASGEERARGLVCYLKDHEQRSKSITVIDPTREKAITLARFQWKSIGNLWMGDNKHVMTFEVDKVEMWLKFHSEVEAAQFHKTLTDAQQRTELRSSQRSTHSHSPQPAKVVSHPSQLSTSSKDSGIVLDEPEHKKKEKGLVGFFAKNAEKRRLRKKERKEKHQDAALNGIDHPSTVWWSEEDSSDDESERSSPAPALPPNQPPPPVPSRPAIKPDLRAIFETPATLAAAPQISPSQSNHTEQPVFHPPPPPPLTDSIKVTMEPRTLPPSNPFSASNPFFTPPNPFLNAAPALAQTPAPAPSSAPTPAMVPAPAVIVPPLKPLPAPRPQPPQPIPRVSLDKPKPVNAFDRTVADRLNRPQVVAKDYKNDSNPRAEKAEKERDELAKRCAELEKKYRRALVLLSQLGHQDETPFEEALKEFVLNACRIGVPALVTEFMTIRAQTHAIGSRPKVAFDANPDKNRYQDVYCVDESRVALAGGEHDYVHANWVDVQPGDRRYICTQGPMAGTVDDFWRMVWQEKCRSIVMLCNVVECGKEKCAQYWPLECGQEVVYGTLRVVATAKEDFEHLMAVTRLTVSDGVSSHEVEHILWNEWPDRGLPTDLLTCFKLLERLKHLSPTVIHCSAGIGRTGTIVGLDLLLTKLEAGEVVTAKDMVLELRQRRHGSVQTDMQYLYLHRALIELGLSKKVLLESEVVGFIDAYDSLCEQRGIF